MQENSQQQCESVVTAKKRTVRTLVDTQSVTLCPTCGAELPEEALFCSECGSPVKQNICPKCGAANSHSADICKFCKTWLLEGKCKFCYTELSSDDALFCPECGKPKDGIPCPHCGTLSIFDFCSKCGKPITEEASAEVAVAQVKTTQAEADTPVTAVDTQTAAIETELAKPEMEIDDHNDVYDPDDYEDETEVVVDEPVRKSLFSAKQIASIRQTGTAMQKVAAIAAANQNANKKFNNNQEARRWHNARRHPDAVGWLCKAYGTVHLYEDGGPNGCEDPSQGGGDYFGETIWEDYDADYGRWVPKK